MSVVVPARAAAFLAALVDVVDAGEPVYMMRHPGGLLGAGISPRGLRYLRRAELVDVGEFVPFKGRRLTITPAGRAAARRPAPLTIIDDPLREDDRPMAPPIEIAVRFDPDDFAADLGAAGYVKTAASRILSPSTVAALVDLVAHLDERSTERGELAALAAALQQLDGPVAVFPRRTGGAS